MHTVLNAFHHGRIDREVERLRHAFLTRQHDLHCGDVEQVVDAVKEIWELLLFSKNHQAVQEGLLCDLLVALRFAHTCKSPDLFAALRGSLWAASRVACAKNEMTKFWDSFITICQEVYNYEADNGNNNNAEIFLTEGSGFLSNANNPSKGGSGSTPGGEAGESPEGNDVPVFLAVMEPSLCTDETPSKLILHQCAGTLASLLFISKYEDVLKAKLFFPIFEALLYIFKHFPLDGKSDDITTETHIMLSKSLCCLSLYCVLAGDKNMLKTILANNDQIVILFRTYLDSEDMDIMLNSVVTISTLVRSEFGNRLILDYVTQKGKFQRAVIKTISRLTLEAGTSKHLQSKTEELVESALISFWGVSLTESAANDETVIDSIDELIDLIVVFARVGVKSKRNVVTLNSLASIGAVFANATDTTFHAVADKVFADKISKNASFKTFAGNFVAVMEKILTAGENGDPRCAELASWIVWSMCSRSESVATFVTRSVKNLVNRIMKLVRINSPQWDKNESIRKGEATRPEPIVTAATKSMLQHASTAVLVLSEPTVMSGEFVSPANQMLRSSDPLTFNNGAISTAHFACNKNNCQMLLESGALELLIHRAVLLLESISTVAYGNHYLNGGKACDESLHILRLSLS
jgi:hypothetical protein